MANNKADPFREFDARMARVAPERHSTGGEDDKPKAGMSHMGIQVGAELVAGVIGGALLGTGVDYLFGTYPFGLLILLVLGFAAGIMNAYRHIQKLGAEDSASGLNRTGKSVAGSTDEKGDTGGQST